MIEYRITICVLASNKEAVEDWLGRRLPDNDNEDIQDFFWTVDIAEMGSAFDE